LGKTSSESGYIWLMLVLCWYCRRVCIHLGRVESSQRSGIAFKHVSVGPLSPFFAQSPFRWGQDDGVVANFCISMLEPVGFPLFPDEEKWVGAGLHLY